MITISLSPEFWLSAYIIARMRSMKGDTYRSESQTRGPGINSLADVHGVAGELAFLKYLSEIEGFANKFSHDLLDIGGPVDGADFYYQDGDYMFGADVKCLLIDDPVKKFFLINDYGHKKARQKKIDVYYCGISIMYGVNLYIGRPLCPLDVDDWDIKDFGYGSPARAARLDTFVPHYFYMTEAQLRSELYTGGQFVTDPKPEAFVDKNLGKIRTLIEESRDNNHNQLPYADVVKFLMTIVKFLKGERV